ncbi:glycosyltransferase family 2 protein [Salinarimonas soli]|uniref:Glycosyltransferase n=1 Tax=Salinarimonas soli TaxID=1638099 RepID=A0A5B2V9C9_9HYPH|nr:glycosyltransferase [Salinarimonas soli]KAA2236103.1 glycosyltransferase [Salinarimonas soli]
MVQHLVSLAPTLLVASFLLFTFGRSRRDSSARAVTCAVVLAVALRYLVWRFTDTVLPASSDEGFGFYWIWFLFGVELLAFTDILLFLVIMSRSVDRSAEADRLEPAYFAQAQDGLPTVDVFIPTYNEPLDVLERTIVGALALDYPRDKLRVYVLDDKRRDWLRAYCEEKGAIHVTRPDNAHAKAGNMNNGLGVSSGDFVAVFDADFVPYRNFLRRTLPFFSDPTIGIVQTPQHFFNADPVQANLGLEHLWPDEQRLFFDEMAPSRDAWDVSFCCGSCSINRRAALDEIGGFPTESITEDLLTTLSMLNKGFKTRYLNERLSMGLAAENLEGYFVQRERWCQGGIQTIYLRNGPLRGPGLTPFQRVMFLPMSWLVQYVVRFGILVVPAVYLWSGIAPLHFTEAGDLVSHQLPVLAAYFLLMTWITPTRYLPVISSAVGAFSTFRMLPTVLSSIVRPFGKPFKVTPKGSGNEEGSFDSYTFIWLAGLTTVSALGLVINIVPEWAQASDRGFSTVAAYWTGVNTLVLTIAALICFERPSRFTDAFRADEPAGLDGLTGRAVSLSLGKAVVQVPIGTRFASTSVTLALDGVEPLRAEIRQITRRRRRLGRAGDGAVHFLHLHYELAGAARDQMIRKLYTGGYSQDVAEIDKSALSVGLIGRALGPERA